MRALHDKDFVSRYCVGFDVFADYVMGRSDGVPKDPKWAEKKSEIPADEIVTLARLMAADRCMIGLSFSVQRAEHGEQTYWAGIALASALGYIGLPGGGLVLGAGVGKMSTMQRKMVPFSVGSLPQGKNAISDFIPLARVTDMLESLGASSPITVRTGPTQTLIWFTGWAAIRFTIIKTSIASGVPGAILKRSLPMRSTGQRPLALRISFSQAHRLWNAKTLPAAAWITG
jgi:biotin/methionine sulfoxide reductase